ncbi:hypothetical protein FLK61_35620 [Paenalkalicoccus suaedae]|uniref:Uncharacterized protein n=1 Tax=Paenalkalicoccus suaedae TaxID=2592382 RepID=A0A859FH56_9BACI|nr:hypothetical protein [Paenalkalicoccus suaedae]QKS71994.1 hypothetical protein FLK61_35620 [Paenalkalicoccus suaedae]
MIYYVLNHVFGKELGIFDEVASAIPDFNHYDVTEKVDVLSVLQEVLTNSWSEEGELAYFCIVKVVANEYSEGLHSMLKQDIRDSVYFEKHCLKLKEVLLLFSRAAVQQYYLKNH